MRVEALGAKSTVERFNERIVGWLARAAKVQCDIVLVRPQIEVTRDDLRNILFPDLPSGKVVMKIGISKSPIRRVREMNVGFPPGSSVRWLLDATRPFSSGDEAFLAEGRLLEQMRFGKKWIGGEFVVSDEDECSPILSVV